jgi:hypothetical protein
MNLTWDAESICECGSICVNAIAWVLYISGYDTPLLSPKRKPPRLKILWISQVQESALLPGQPACRIAIWFIEKDAVDADAAAPVGVTSRSTSE